MTHDRQSNKKIYATPRLLIYGDIRQLTQATIIGPMSDTVIKADMNLMSG